jgi:hypothetical protein
MNETSQVQPNNPNPGATTSDPSPTPGEPSFTVTTGDSTQFEITVQNDDSTHITLGSTDTPNDIYLNGGLRYNITTKSDTGTSYTLTDNDCVVLFTSATYTSCTVPAAATRTGKVYIIIRNFGGDNTFTVNRTGSDTFDGETSYPLPAGGTRVYLISDGISSWSSL